jgi:hypothetical protein
MLELRDGTRKKWQASLTHTGLHKTNTKWLMHSWSTFGARTSHEQLGHTILTRPELEGSHHLPLYSILCMSQPHFGLSVRMKLTLPKVGTWSPLGLPKTQSSSSGVKTPRIEVFFIPLKSSWSVDVRNGLAWVIWTFAAQVMGKRRAGNQNGSLTPDH